MRCSNFQLNSARPFNSVSLRENLGLIKSVLSNAQMQYGNRLLTGIERRSLQTLQSVMGRIGPSEAVQQFYLKSDSALFALLKSRWPGRGPRSDRFRYPQGPRPLLLKIQLPLPCVWQSNVEVNRVLSIRLGKVKAITARTALSNATSPDKKSM